MLAKSAVKKFLARDLGSFEFMKGLTRRQLLRMINDLEPKPEFISPKPMWKQQMVSFLIGVYSPQILLFLDMGLGKSRVILDLIAYFKKCKKLKAALIVAPNDIAVENWVIEVETHRPDLKYIPLYGSTEQRLALLERKADVFIISYPGLSAMCSGLKATKGRTKKKKKKKRKRQIIPKRLAWIAAQFNFICLDESTAIMHHQSLTYRVCFQLSRNYKYRIGMAGIPMGRNPENLWSQFNFCDHGETLGETLGLYRSAFFKKKVNYWSGYYDYVFDKKKTDYLHQTLQNRSISYSESECTDMPKLIYKPVYVPFSKDMKVHYNKMVGEIKKDRHNLRLTRNSFLHMRQLASGFIGFIDDDTDERIQIEFPENPKMEALTQIVNEISERRKFLIYYEYNWTGDRISKELDQLGIRYGRLYGKQKDGPAILRRFVKSNKLRGLVINNHCGAFALNLQAANYEIFIEPPVSPIVRGQAEKRIHRGGQTRHCFIIDIIMKDNTADELIRKHVKEGRNIERRLMSGKSKLNLRKV